MRFSGKGVIVTGSSSGIGKATALLFAKEGANVLIHGRDRNTLETTLEQCKTTGVQTAKFCMVQGSFDEQETLSKIFNKAMEVFGRIDMLVNNAGQAESGTLLTATEESFDRQIHLHLKVPIFLSKLCFPELKKTQGNIVNISSMCGTRPRDRGIFFNIAEAGLNQFTKCAAIEYGSEGVRINAICPGYVRTEVMYKCDPSVTTGQVDAKYKALAKGVPIKKVGTPEETAKLIVFLASEDASMMNGACIVQDGGHSLMGLDTQTIENAAKCN